jgi:hypothetical protein
MPTRDTDTNIEYSCICCEVTIEDEGDVYSDRYGEHHCCECYWDYYSECYDCGVECVSDESWDSNREEYFCESCYCSSQELIDVQSLSLPLNSRESKENQFKQYNIRRMVGLEIECLVPDGDSMWTPTHWANVSDGSINTEDSGYYGVEMVSRPANGDLLLNSIDKLMSWKEEQGAHVNVSCGFHVHFNSIDMSPREVAHVGIVYAKYQSILKSIMPPSRQSSNWCRDFPLNFNSLKNIYTEEELAQEYYEYMGCSYSTDKYNEARYCAMNLHSRYYHGTIEFRLHSGTINKVKIINWISILNKIIDMGIKLANDEEKVVKQWVEEDVCINRMFGSKLSKYITKRQRVFSN